MFTYVVMTVETDFVFSSIEDVTNFMQKNTLVTVGTKSAGKVFYIIAR